jgi:Domain of unknown function (DUF4189)
MKLTVFLVLCLIPCSSMVSADNGCVYGESATGPRSQANPLGCVPDPRTLQQPQVQPEQPQAPRGHWETRWGAIALDPMKGKLGAVTNYKSESSATKAAMAECYRQGGGKDCKLSMKYYNQCAAVAWGDKGYASAGRDVFEEANQDALQRCGKITTNCEVVYNACSNAQWISY